MLYRAESHLWGDGSLLVSCGLGKMNRKHLFISRKIGKSELMFGRLIDDYHITIIKTDFFPHHQTIRLEGDTLTLSIFVSYRHKTYPN